MSFFPYFFNKICQLAQPVKTQLQGLKHYVSTSDWIDCVDVLLGASQQVTKRATFVVVVFFSSSGAISGFLLRKDGIHGDLVMSCNSCFVFKLPCVVRSDLSSSSRSLLLHLSPPYLTRSSHTFRSIFNFVMQFHFFLTRSGLHHFNLSML